jgi:hypothetical protein
MAPMLIAPTAALLAQAGSGSEASSLDNMKAIVDIIGTAVTAAAVVIGGIWAYFRFVKGRTYRPRLEPGLSGEWRLIDGKCLLQARVTVKNIGASKVTLLQKGTGLRVSVLAAGQPPIPAPAEWEILKVFEILREHEWIEPDETIYDDLLLNLGTFEPVLTLFEARLVSRWSRFGRNIEVFARRVIPVNSTIGEHQESIAAAAVREERTNP